MAREKKIIDASVIVKWFQSEPDSEKAIQLRTKHLEEETMLIIPDLVPWHVNFETLTSTALLFHH